MKNLEFPWVTQKKKGKRGGVNEMRMGSKTEERMHPNGRELGKRQPERSAMLWPKIFKE